MIQNIAKRGEPIEVAGVAPLRVMATFQAVNVALNTSLLLLPTIPTWKRGDHSKALLTKHKGFVLLGWYVLVLIVAAPILLSMPSEGTR